MRSAFAAVLSFGVLAGCSLPPAEEAGEEEAVIAETGVPGALAGHVVAVDFVPASNRLVLTVIGLDGPEVAVTYERKTGLDTGSYQVYTYQQNALNRHFTAIGSESAGGEVLALVVSDGGQFNRHFSGGYYARDGLFYTPTGEGGQVTYAGLYEGVTNLNALGANLAVPDPSIDPAILPSESARVEGSILINVNFADNLVNGSVFERLLNHQAYDETDQPRAFPLPLPDIALVSGDLSEDGTFFGETEFRGSVGGTSGNFGGILGGADAAYAAGVVSLNDIDEGLYGWTTEAEFGVFVLTQCGQAGDHAICDSLD